MKTISAVAGGLYAWMVTAYFGFVVLDLIYARWAGEAFAEAADLLLLAGFVTVLAGFGAAAVGWQSRMAVVFFGASVLALLLEFFLPVFVTLLFPSAPDLAWLRPFPSGLASVLAFVGLYGALRGRWARVAVRGI